MTSTCYQSHFHVDINNTHRIRVTSPSDDLSVAVVRRALQSRSILQSPTCWIIRYQGQQLSLRLVHVDGNWVMRGGGWTEEEDKMLFWTAHRRHRSFQFPLPSINISVYHLLLLLSVSCVNLNAAMVPTVFWLIWSRVCICRVNFMSSPTSSSTGPLVCATEFEGAGFSSELPRRRSYSLAHRCSHRCFPLSLWRQTSGGLTQLGKLSPITREGSQTKSQHTSLCRALKGPRPCTTRP